MSQPKEKPTGLLRVVGVEQDRPAKSIAVYAKVLVEDEAGR